MNAPQTFTSITLRKSSGVHSITGATCMIPALFTSTSADCDQCCSIALNAASIDWAELTSIACASALLGRWAFNSAATARALSR